MPGASAAALICDTGALIDYLVESSPDHELFREAIFAARTRYVPGLVLAEVDCLRDEREAMHAFHQDIAEGAFTYAPLSTDQLARAPAVNRRFVDLRLGLVDASIVALAEAVGVKRLLTRDFRDFAAVRLRDGAAFELAAHPSRPER